MTQGTKGPESVICMYMYIHIHAYIRHTYRKIKVYVSVRITYIIVRRSRLAAPSASQAAATKSQQL